MREQCSKAFVSMVESESKKGLDPQCDGESAWLHEG